MNSRRKPTAEYHFERLRRKDVLKVLAIATLIGLITMYALAFAASAIAAEVTTDAQAEAYSWDSILSAALGVVVAGAIGAAVYLGWVESKRRRTSALENTCKDKEFIGFSSDHRNVQPTKPWNSFEEPTRKAPPMPEVKAPRPARCTDCTKEYKYRQECVDSLLIDKFSRVLKERVKDGRDQKFALPDHSDNETLEISLKMAMRDGDIINISIYCMLLNQRGIKVIK
jgi:hypothetical protein